MLTGRSALTVQFTLPCELAVSANVSVSAHIELLQAEVSAIKLEGLVVSVAVVQLHGTATELTPVCPEKVKVPF